MKFSELITSIWCVYLLLWKKRIFYLKTALFSDSKNILFDNLKCLESHKIFKMAEPLIISLKALNDI